MAVVLGNLALILDISHRTIIVDRKTRPLPSDAVLSFFNKKDHHSHKAHNHNQVAAASSPEKKRRGKSKVNAASNGDEEREEEREEEVSWEEEMRRRVREMEDMRELEKMAEEMIQSRGAEEEGETEEEEERESGGGEEETEEEKRARVKRELQKVAKEQAERRKMAELMFDLGQKAYGKGMYGRAVEFLEGSLTIIPRPTLFGGEIQIWLAMAYEANNRHADCIALYKKLETSHPSFGIRRQAAELRYILQAPKLKISQEEMVTIPLIGSSYDSYAGTWSDKNKDKDEKRYRSTTNQLSSDKDYLGDFLVWRPPSGWEKNRNFWIALTLWLSLAGAAVFLQN